MSVPTKPGSVDSSPEQNGRVSPRLDRTFELVEAIILAVAAVMTAWTAFQSTKWTGVQADNYAQASATRVESTRASTSAGQLGVVDVSSFLAWVDAIGDEMRAGIPVDIGPDTDYTPSEGTQSGFLYERFTDELHVAVDAWLATYPLEDPDAPPTPFAMPEYQLAGMDRADELEQEAESHTARAREANQNGDNYVLMTIMFAVVLFFIGVGTKMDTLRARGLLLGLSVTVFLVAAVVVVSFPKEL